MNDHIRMDSTQIKMKTQAALPDRETTARLRQLVASAISDHKAYDLTGICSGYGLAYGTEEEAFRSKFKYVIQRLQNLPSAEVLRVARAVQLEEASAGLDEELAKFDERDGAADYTSHAPANYCRA